MRTKAVKCLALALVLCMMLPQMALAATTYSLKVTLKGPDKNDVPQTVENESSPLGIPNSGVLKTVAQGLFTTQIQQEIETKFTGTGLGDQFTELRAAALAVVTSGEKTAWENWVNQYVTDSKAKAILKSYDAAGYPNATFQDVLDRVDGKIIARYGDRYTVTIEVVEHDLSAPSGGGGGGGAVITPELPDQNGYASCTKDHICPIYPFKDASSQAWYHDGVHFCIDEGLMNGYNATTFAPNGVTTRAMVVTMLWRLEGKPEAEHNTSFEDVAEGTYYGEAVNWAQGSGVVYGFSDTEFAPNRQITREQLIAIMWRYAQYKGVDVSAGGKMDLSGYTDLHDVASYALDAVKWSVCKNVVKGKTDTTLDPRSDATRAQIATIFQRYCVDVIR